MKTTNTLQCLHVLANGATWFQQQIIWLCTLKNIKCLFVFCLQYTVKGYASVSKLKYTLGLTVYAAHRPAAFMQSCTVLGFSAMDMLEVILRILRKLRRTSQLKSWSCCRVRWAATWIMNSVVRSLCRSCTRVCDCSSFAWFDGSNPACFCNCENT